jgi:hypothetical protein
MTFAPVGSIFGGEGTALASFSLTPSAVGDLILIEVVCYGSGTFAPTALSSSNVTWSAPWTAFTGTVNPDRANVFMGKVTSTSAATVTITFSGSVAGVVAYAGQEFSSTVGSWAADGSQGNLDSAGTANWPSLTPSVSGDIYFGYAFSETGSSTAGSTSGYTYSTNADTLGDCLAYNPACGAGATFPVWGSSDQGFGIMVLVKETGAAPVAVSRSGWFVARTVPSVSVWGGIAAPPPPAAAVSGSVQPRATVPVPRRQPARVLWRGVAVPGVTSLPNRQPPLTVFRRQLARAYVRFTPVATVNATGIAVPAPRQQPRPAPRRTLARAYIRFTPVTTVNAPPAATPTALAPDRGDYERNRLLRRRPRWLADPLGEVPLVVAAPPPIELASSWPGVWPGPWPQPVPIPPEPEPEPEPEPVPEPTPPPKVPVYVRPPRQPREYPGQVAVRLQEPRRKYPDRVDGWRRR